ncbi:MAG: NADH-quinone oxidoreductase subunit L [Bryobacterales bacterium]|nr:NADH-quinone oxidoreductase subunit L [Bryobacterales bacterium]
MQLWLIPLVPLIGFVINGVFGHRAPKRFVNFVAVGSVAISFALVLRAISALWPLDNAYVEQTYTWIQSGNLRIGVDFVLDRLSAVMLLVVSGVGLLIHTYSIGYMEHEGSYARFFSYMNLFMFFMLTLVLGGNFPVLFVGWEGVGLCSYLLIGFYYDRDYAVTAGNKAFIVNRIGDMAFIIAIFLVFLQFGTFDFVQIAAKVDTLPVEAGFGALSLITLLLFVGATGKSAQIPLYVWLPDAMAGPTPVSALIHAATMVTAGVYMVARTATMYQHTPIVMEVVAIVGLATAVVSAIIGLAQNDIKKVFAYSTVSQLGYMFLALGVGAFSAGIFHVMTHAFFKALLFLGAGSVIHAVHGEQDIWKMGGLRKKTPVTFLTLMVAGVAISGVYPFAGFFSKDEILLAAHHHAPWMYWVATATAGMTAFYVFRALFVTFFGEYRGHAHPHESPPSMTLPLVGLAILSTVGGFLNVPHFLEAMFPLAEGGHDATLVYIALATGLGGILLAYVFYVVNPGIPQSIANGLGAIYRLVVNKFYVDEIYDFLVVRPVLTSSRDVFWAMDRVIVDGAVNGVASQARAVGRVLRSWQTGSIRTYASWVAIGSVIIMLIVSIAGGVR